MTHTILNILHSLTSTVCYICVILDALYMCIFVCSLNHNRIGAEGGMALGEALTENQTLEILR